MARDGGTKEADRATIRELYQAARAVPDEEREDFLTKAPYQVEIKASVRSLLKHGDATDEAIVPQAARSTRSFSDASPSPESIGAYRILEEIGTGGFGIVYLAERRKPHVQRVALKVLKPGMDSREILTRFEAERQALALMNHPNIAQVHDAGMMETGRPYFVMEYVRGEPITQFCDRHRLTIKQRLELFIPICDAVQHAHTKGIIHRDLKPGNVLVSVEGAQFAPKIIDFGVAKALSQRLTENTLVTEYGRIIGTPEYMSPEQVEMSSVDIDARTDIYSLGVMLYQLLGGVLPFETDSLRDKSHDEMQRMIREVDPPALGARVTKLGAAAKKIAQQRQMKVESLTGILRHELEWIPMKAMRKDRTHRYRTAVEMADDLRDYLDGRPLLAGPESSAYRVRKFMRRHRAEVSTIVAIVMALLIGFAGMTWQAVRARQAEAERRDAASQTGRLFDHVRNMASLVMFDLHDEIAKLDGSLEAQVLLVTTADEYLTKLQDESVDQPALLRDIADGRYRLGTITGGKRAANLGRHEEALRHYQAALEIRRQLVGRDPALPEAKRDVLVADIGVGDALSMLGRHESALEEYRRAEEVAEELVSVPSMSGRIERERATVAQSIGDQLLKLDDPAGALEEFEESYALKKEILRRNPTDETAQRDLSTLLIRLGFLIEDEDPARALEYYEEAQALRLDAFRRDPDERSRRDLAWADWRVGSALLRLDRLEQCREHFTRAFESFLVLYRADVGNRRGRRDLKIAFTSLGQFLEWRGDRAALIQAYRVVVEVFDLAVDAHPGETAYSEDLRQFRRELDVLLDGDGGDD